MNTFTEIIGLLEAIPSAFWGVIVGSFFSIGGVALTNLASDRRLRAQFEHERVLKTKDREMALRKEIYLEAAEAIAAGMNSISRFANLEIQHDEITKAYAEKAPAISKVHVIARTETVQALAGFTTQLNSLFLTLFAQRYEFQRTKNAISILDDQIVEFGKERDRILELMKQHNIEGAVNERRWEVLQNSFEFEQKRVAEAIAQRDELMRILYPKQLEFMRDCVAHSARLSQLLIPVLSAVRNELELPLDEDAYCKIAETSLAYQQEAIDTFIKAVTSTAAQSGKGRLLTGPPHTTRHAGPHRAVHQQGAHDFPHA